MESVKTKKVRINQLSINDVFYYGENIQFRIMNLRGGKYGQLITCQNLENNKIEYFFPYDEVCISWIEPVKYCYDYSDKPMD